MQQDLLAKNTHLSATDFRSPVLIVVKGHIKINQYHPFILAYILQMKIGESLCAMLVGMFSYFVLVTHIIKNGGRIDLKIFQETLGVIIWCVK